jgi:hypothetical protein
MIAPLDLFRTEPNGSPLWLNSFPNVEAAEARAKELAKDQPGEYFILNVKTGHKQPVKTDEA